METKPSGRARRRGSAPAAAERPDARARRIDREFAAWERLRRQLVERESHWAAAVTSTADQRRLAALRRELADLHRELDESFRRAMGALEKADA